MFLVSNKSFYETEAVPVIPLQIDIQPVASEKMAEQNKLQPIRIITVLDDSLMDINVLSIKKTHSNCITHQYLNNILIWDDKDHNTLTIPFESRTPKLYILVVASRCEICSES